jgi:EAL domain-containing protein (putative c-di-GMP-specific phosphodiesterase class I)
MVNAEATETKLSLTLVLALAIISTSQLCLRITETTLHQDIAMEVTAAIQPLIRVIVKFAATEVNSETISVTNLHNRPNFLAIGSL